MANFDSDRRLDAEAVRDCDQEEQKPDLPDRIKDFLVGANKIAGGQYR